MPLAPQHPVLGLKPPGYACRPLRGWESSDLTLPPATAQMRLRIVILGDAAFPNVLRHISSRTTKYNSPTAKSTSPTSQAAIPHRASQRMGLAVDQRLHQISATQTGLGA